MTSRGVLAAALLAATPGAMAAQRSLGGQVVPVLTHATAGPDGARTALALVAPVLHGTVHGLAGRLRLHVSLNGEGLTMPGGQLALSGFGEGFVDKRHPHTWGHEVIISLVDPVPLPLGLHWSLTAGKGFAPYGSDDPMNRPAVIFPVNHHWSQILERGVAIAGLQRGPVTLEVGVFNGDEPEHWDQWPSWRRFGDSWSSRLLVRAAAGLELQASVADVKSPEHRPGAGPHHTKVSLSGRASRPLGGGQLTGMVEWARTSELHGFFTYYSTLAEAQWQVGRRRPYLRFELTDRPEEERVFGEPFRSRRPHFENSNLGITRWTGLTAGLGVGVGSLFWPVQFESVGEAQLLHVRSVTGGVFVPVTFYGRNTLWMFSVALRISAGAPMHRMGRYGVAMTDHSDHGSTAP